MWRNRGLVEYIEYDPDKEYTNREKEIISDQILRADAKQVNEETGKPRGIGGDNPILFPEHEYARKRREIMTKSGTPDPELVSGLYNRSHPQGRKVNSAEARAKHGASYYRSVMPFALFGNKVDLVLVLLSVVMLVRNRWHGQEN